ncbi:MAG: transposase [Bdellovibrionales bacterium]|nr:transposase [Bdellovibrionales bacterium]
MARSKTILQSEYPYNINSKCINDEWFNLPMDMVWEVFSEELYLANKIYDLKIHSFVLMSNHFHLIATTPQSNIDQCMNRFMTQTSTRIRELGNRKHWTFAGRYFKTILNEPSYFLNAYKYNYFNPVKAKICKNVEDYKYSTLHGLLGLEKLIVPLEEDTVLFDSPKETLDWLNNPVSEEKLEAVNFGLKRSYFKSKKCRKTNKLILDKGEII